MVLFKPFLTSLAEATASTRSAARKALPNRLSTAPFPVVAACPSPSCPCAETPDGLDIDRWKSLNGTMAPHAQHVLIASAREDWTSKIEDEKDTGPWGQFGFALKKSLGPGGKFHDPYNNIMITMSSFAAPSSTNNTSVNALLFPAFKQISGIDVGTSSIDQFIQGFLLPTRLHPPDDLLPDSEKKKKLRQLDARTGLEGNLDSVRSPTILICSHGGRDKRCGVLGPLLRSEFQQQLSSRDFEVSTSFSATSSKPAVNIGSISHIGGHKWAGNIIIYIPPFWNFPGATETSPLAGKGIWYGRVEPKHVEGIVEETLCKGNVIKELFRGGIDESGEILRL